MLEQFDIERFRNTKCGVLSSGEQTRAGLAKAMLNQPHLLLLDEPTASLDPASARDIRAEICEFAGQEAVGVLWTSHNMVEVEKVCDRVLFLSHGKILLEGDPKTLPREYGKETLEDLFITVARRAADAGEQRRMMHLSRIAAILLRQFYLIRGSPARLLPLFVWAGVDIVLWGFITRYLNTVNPVRPQFRPDAARGRPALGLLHPRDVRRDDDVPRRRLVAQLPEPVRDAAVDLGVPRRPGDLEHRDQLDRPGRDARSWRLWSSACPSSSTACC